MCSQLNRNGRAIIHPNLAEKKITTKLKNNRQGWSIERHHRERRGVVTLFYL